MKVYSEKDTMLNVCRTYNKLKSNHVETVNFDVMFNKTKEFETTKVKHNEEVLNRTVLIFLETIKTN